METGQCLGTEQDDEDGTIYVQLQTCEDFPHQKWTIQKVIKTNAVWNEPDFSIILF